MRRSRPHGYFGIAAIVVMVLILVPVSLMLLQRSTDLNRLMAFQKGNQASRRATHSLATEFMSQFSKGTGFFEDHYAPSFVNRTKTLFENSFANVEVIPNRQARTLLIKARGEYGSNANVSRGLEVLIHFVPILGNYFAHMGQVGMRNSEFTFKGPVRADSDLTSTNVTYSSMVVVGGNVNSFGTTVFNEHLYYGGILNPPFQKNPAMYKGGVTQVRVPGNLIPLDVDYYQINATTQAPMNQTVWWEFRDMDGAGLPVSEYRSRLDQNGDHNFTGDAVVWSDWTPIPAAGGIFLGRFSKTFVSGTVRGHVTVVSLCSIGDGEETTGTIEVIGPTFSYSGNNRFSSATSSIHLFSTHGFYFRGVSPDNLVVSACVYSDDPAVNRSRGAGALLGFTANWTDPSHRAGHRFEFYGSLNNVDGNADSGLGPAANLWFWDPNLTQISAPGVPERPVIISWRRTS